jgi:SsrA-binding protein
MKLEARLKQGGITVVPLLLYFKAGKVKVEIGLAIGKKKYDKRASIKKSEAQRETARAMRKKLR